MLILFHCIGILIFQLLRYRKRIKFLQALQENKHTECVLEESSDLENNIKFDPPVFRQRYGKVYEILLDEKWRTQVKKIVDFGCSEFGLFVFVKRLTCINQLYFVDIDEDTLRYHIGKIYPLTIEFLRRRSQPLEVSVFAGSVADPDYRLSKTDAVTAIELIEHLYPDVLDAFPYNIFNYIEPKIVIVTTPNADFNVLFSSNIKRFRHLDHKFEWTREQFEDWASNIVTRFPDYSVTFYGIGEGPKCTSYLGQCSQMAVFIRKDLIDSSYLSKKYAISCLCDNKSPCKGLNAESKMLCTCICAMCSPHSSFGVCSYHSYSKQVISYEIGSNEDDENLSYNIFYKLIDKVEYPYDYDYRTEEEKILDEVRYRINNFGKQWGRYYIEDKDRSEIPIRELIYGSDLCCITESELDKLLTKHGYSIEECQFSETDQIEKCVIYEPEMEEISSTSEASGYNSDFQRYHVNEESLSDWDESYTKKETNESCDSYETSKDLVTMDVSPREPPAEIDASMDEDNKHDALIDSGYQKSLSLLDDSPQTPMADLDETDLFEETMSSPSLSSDDNKVHLRRANSKLEKAPPLDFAKLKVDSNKVNELDSFQNMLPGRTFLNNLLKPQPELLKKFTKDSLPGPSNLYMKKKKKIKKGVSTDSEDDSPFDDVKSITECIIKNTLNKLEINDQKNNKDDVIEFNVEADVVEEQAPVDEPLLLELQEPVLVVENGDLANNNRDIEGNNYIAQANEEEAGHDIENDNLEIVEEPVAALEENVNVDNNNHHAEHLQVIEDPPIIFEEGAHVENVEDALQQPENPIAGSSREALCDPDSEQSLLEDFEIATPVHGVDMVDVVNLGNSIVLIGVHPLPNDNDGQGLSVDHQNGFPNWLLQILGTQVAAEEAPPPILEEPHYYCQGDGLGVHPSVIAVEVEEDEEESSNSSNNTADYEEVEQGPSTQDMTSLPEDSLEVMADHLEIAEDVTEREMEASTSQQTTYFDSVSSSDTGIGSSGKST